MYSLGMFLHALAGGSSFKKLVLKPDRDSFVISFHEIA